MSVAEHAEHDVRIEAGEVVLPGTLSVPSRARGVVLFVHGSGSSRLSTRNRAVAGSLVGRGFATLLFDLLTEPEAADRRNVFDIDLLARRVLEAAAWTTRDEDVGSLRLGLFGASTGAAAALVASAEPGMDVAAIVSRGRRPDLAGPALPRVTAPTLLIVGAKDVDVLSLNLDAQRRLRCPSSLEVVAGASHLFEEPGTLEEVARLAGEWFEAHLPGAG